jgi:hypothetical protein
MFFGALKVFKLFNDIRKAKKGRELIKIEKYYYYFYPPLIVVLTLLALNNLVSVVRLLTN